MEKGKLCAVLAIPFLIATAVDAGAQEVDSQTMLVLDGSGSMWGQIDGVAKIEIARDAIDRMLNDWPENRGLGLIAYGHRTEGDCTDIETLVTPGTLDRTSFDTAIEGVTPLGKTMIGASVEASVEALSGQDLPSSIIVVTDGLETCGANLCALGDKLAKGNTQMTAHVIGFDVEDSEGQLACLAETTGGRYLPATDAESLTGALQEVREDTTESQPADPLRVDEFERSELGGTWTIDHSEPTGFILEDGALMTMTVQSGAIGTEEQPNIFRWTDVELPEGDWDITASFTSQMGEVKTLGGRKAVIEVGRYADPRNFVIARLYRQGNSNDDMHLQLLAVSNGNETKQGLEIAGDVRGYDLAQILKDFEEKGAELTLSKRGREYQARLSMKGWTLQADGPETVATDPVTVLRSTGDPALFSGTWGSEQTITEFNRIEILEVE